MGGEKLITIEEQFEDTEWTADFSEFRKKAESIFGPLENLAETDPDVYAHWVLSHGFMEYAGVEGLLDGIKAEIAGSEEQFLQVICNPAAEQGERYREEFREKAKGEYTRWAKANNLPEDLLEDGWQAYLND